MTEPTRQGDRGIDGRSAPAPRPEEQPGTSEGRRVVELLWAPAPPPPVRGPKPRISLADVVAAGVAIADTEGMAALSMRKVANRLGWAPCRSIPTSPAAPSWSSS